MDYVGEKHHAFTGIKVFNTSNIGQYSISVNILVLIFPISTATMSMYFSCSVLCHSTGSGGRVMHSDSFGSEMNRLSTLIDRLEGKVCGLCNVELI